MSKIEGRKVRLVLSTADMLGLPEDSLLQDLLDVGSVYTVTRVYNPERNSYPVVLVDRLGRSDIYKAEQLRYLNNRKVVL